MSTTFRPRFGRYLCLAMWLICGYALVSTAVGSGTEAAARTVPWLGLLAGGTWALFWRPRVTVDDAGVHLVNVLRTIDVPWPAIQRIDTKWALTLYTGYGTFTAWAAPAPGGVATLRQELPRRGALPASALGDGYSVRPGDLPGTPSGAAALVVRRRWEELRDAGHLDNPRLEFSTVPMRWHGETIAGAAVLILASVVTVI